MASLCPGKSSGNHRPSPGLSDGRWSVDDAHMGLRDEGHSYPGRVVRQAQKGDVAAVERFPPRLRVLAPFLRQLRSSIILCPASLSYFEGRWSRPFRREYPVIYPPSNIHYDE
jgi:hypothetical protein